MVKDWRCEWTCLSGERLCLELEQDGAQPSDVFGILVALRVEVAQLGNLLPLVADLRGVA